MIFRFYIFPSNCQLWDHLLHISASYTTTINHLLTWRSRSKEGRKDASFCPPAMLSCFTILLILLGHFCQGLGACYHDGDCPGQDQACLDRQCVVLGDACGIGADCHENALCVEGKCKFVFCTGREEDEGCSKVRKRSIHSSLPTLW